MFHLRLSGEYFPTPPFILRAHLEEAKAPGRDIFSCVRSDWGGLVRVTMLSIGTGLVPA